MAFPREPRYPNLRYLLHQNHGSINDDENLAPPFLAPSHGHARAGATDQLSQRGDGGAVALGLQSRHLSRQPQRPRRVQAVAARPGPRLRPRRTDARRTRPPRQYAKSRCESALAQGDRPDRPRGRPAFRRQERGVSHPAWLARCRRFARSARCADTDSTSGDADRALHHATQERRHAPGACGLLRWRQQGRLVARRLRIDEREDRRLARRPRPEHGTGRDDHRRALSAPASDGVAGIRAGAKGFRLEEAGRAQLH